MNQLFTHPESLNQTLADMAGPSRTMVVGLRTVVTLKTDRADDFCALLNPLCDSVNVMIAAAGGEENLLIRGVILRIKGGRLADSKAILRIKAGDPGAPILLNTQYLTVFIRPWRYYSLYLRVYCISA